MSKIPFATLKKTVKLIKEAHAGAFYEPGVPYYKHPIAAARLLPKDTDAEVVLATLLHDVIEDTSITAQDLLDLGYSERTVSAVELATRATKKQMIDPATGVKTIIETPYPGGVFKEGMSYLEWINAIIASGNTDAMLVKYADMQTSGNPESLKRLSQERSDYLKDKYKRTRILLRDALEISGLIKSEGRNFP